MKAALALPAGVSGPTACRSAFTLVARPHGDRALLALGRALATHARPAARQDGKAGLPPAESDPVVVRGIACRSPWSAPI